MEAIIPRPPEEVALNLHWLDERLLALDGIVSAVQNSSSLEANELVVAAAVIADHAILKGASLRAPSGLVQLSSQQNSMTANFARLDVPAGGSFPVASSPLPVAISVSAFADSPAASPSSLDVRALAIQPNPFGAFLLRPTRSFAAPALLVNMSRTGVAAAASSFVAGRVLASFAIDPMSCRFIVCTIGCVAWVPEQQAWNMSAQFVRTRVVSPSLVECALPRPALVSVMWHEDQGVVPPPRKRVDISHLPATPSPPRLCSCFPS